MSGHDAGGGGETRPGTGRAVAIAGNAAAALGALAAATDPGDRWPGLRSPADAAGVLAGLAEAADALVVTVAGLTGWLEYQLQDGRLDVLADAESLFAGDPLAAVATAGTSLDEARAAARALARLLAEARAATADLAPAPPAGGGSAVTGALARELAAEAGAAIHALTYATRPAGYPGRRGPVEAYAAVGELAGLAVGLDQNLRQLLGFLETRVQDGRLDVTEARFAGDPLAATAAVGAELAAARAAAADLGKRLHAAHNLLADLYDPGVLE